MRSLAKYCGFTLLLGSLGFSVTAVAPAQALGELKATFLYSLSNFTGIVPYAVARMSVNLERDEVSVLFQNGVSVFDENGMEVYHFGDDLDAGYIQDLAVTDKGETFMLCLAPFPAPTYNIIHCNYRGEPKEEMKVKGLPAAFPGFLPDRVKFRNGFLYLADTRRFMVVKTDLTGAFVTGWNIASVLPNEKEGSYYGMSGFNVGDDGSILFTVAALFKVFRFYPEGNLISFGRPGGAPGKFNVVNGIALDKEGRYLVVDRLKCTVAVFDKEFNYLTQFGYRGYGRGNLIAPEDIAVDREGRVYVTQSAQRGVNVYSVGGEQHSGAP